ncbi:hypothetical protein GCM10025770_17460 [Viridibacterium curvum]|uniref:Uncharacterized protein n=2 Tax=Viridibacterium curvum TaxID=1101404 RepID=A0ABP9QM28_9RHOO
MVVSPTSSLLTQAVLQTFQQTQKSETSKKIHESLKRRQLAEKAKKIFRERDEREREFVAQYGHARPPLAIKAFGDKMMVAIGGGLYQQTREGIYTFLDAIHDHALHFFGEPMLEAEERKPLNERHPALQWMAAYVENHNKVIASDNVGLKTSQIGAGAAWYRFAYDLYTIRDNAKLEAELKRRLINADEFQGARHELWVAALSVAAGFTLEFEDESNNSTKHPEFVGTNKFSGIRIAVEAKSRRRKSAYGYMGGKDIQPGEIVDIRQLVVDAFTKKNDLPLYVFVDVNLPSADTETYQRWLDEIDQTMADLAQEGYADPAPANVVFFSNDPSHYLRDEQIGKPQDCLWIKPFEATNPATPHPEINDVASLYMNAWRQRAVPPIDFPNLD